MATYHLQDCKLYVAEFDVSGDVNQATLGHTTDELDVTTFGNTHRNRLNGLEDVNLDLSGFYYADGTSGPDDVFYSRLGGAGEIVTVGPTDGTEGEKAYSFQSVHLDYTAPDGDVGSAAQFSVTAQGRGRLIRGTVMEDGTTARTATFDGTGRQLGAVAAGEKLYGFLHVLSASGTTPTLDVTVESDDNSGFTSPITRLTYTQATGTTSELQTADGAISDDWFRVAATIGGTSPSFTFVLALGIR